MKPVAFNYDDHIALQKSYDALAMAAGELVAENQALRRKDGKRGQYMKLIYIAHPFGGERENVDKVEQIIKGLIHKHPDCTFYSPLHATGFLYSQLTYLDGMEHCFEALSRCDELWICGFWRDSVGCCMEYGYAKGKGIPVKFITTPEANAMGSEKCNRFFIDDGGQCSAPSCWDEDKRDYRVGVTCGGDKTKCCLSDRHT